MLLKHLKGQISKDVTHKAGVLQGEQAQLPTERFGI
jgi:hypothetical protein